MPPVVNPAATIPYEIASDIEYAEQRMRTFDKWAFKDGRRARRNVHDAVVAYGRVWGKLGDRLPFSLDNARPYSVRFGLSARKRLPDDPVVAKAVEVAAAIADLEANPLIYSTGMDKALLHRELARKATLERMVKALGDLVRDLVQQDYVHLQPGDWVRVPFWSVVGQVAVVKSARTRVTTAERYSNMDRIHTGHRYTNWDLVRVTLEKIPPPVPQPLCVPGFEWLLKAVDEQRNFDFYYELKWSGLLQYHTPVQDIEFAVGMLFVSEQTSETMNTYTQRRYEFPEEYSAYFPDWIEGRLRTHYELAGQLHALHLKQKPQINPPRWDQPPAVVQALLELGREMIDLLAHYIAGQMGRELGAQLLAHGDYVKILGEELLDTIDEEFVQYRGRSATLIRQSGRTLTVEFDPDEALPGLHEIDVTDVRA